jgi:hypothetical protein
MTIRKLTVREALREAMAEEMRKSPEVYVIGEEVAEYNGAYKVTQGLLAEFGSKRVVDTPITEQGFAGLAIGSVVQTALLKTNDTIIAVDYYNLVKIEYQKCKINDLKKPSDLNECDRRLVKKSLHDRISRPNNSANPLYQNARKINHQFEARYLKPVQSAIEGAASGSLGERSPIMEMIQYISSHTSLNADDNPGAKRLVLVSDLLQHSESYSSYSNKSYVVPSGLLSNLKGWNVNVLAPKRYGSDQSLQAGENIKMWNSLFKAAGASSINIKFLP